MRSSVASVFVGLAVLAGWAESSTAADDKKGEVVELGGLKSQVPATWKKEDPTNPQMRVYQIKLPKAAGDKDDAELVVFYFGPGGGGGVEDNIKRWQSTFDPPEGKKIDDVSKIEKFDVGKAKVTYLDIQGTYKYKFPPLAPNAKITRKENYRQLGVVFAVPVEKDGTTQTHPYFLRLVGPAKTIAAHKDAFDKWLKNFK